MSAKPPSKTQVLNTIAEQTGLKKQDVVSVLDSLGSQISSALNSEAGAFTIPGLCKIVRQIKPATPERPMKSPFTGEINHTATAYLTFVAIDKNNKPSSIPKIIPETKDEKRRYEKTSCSSNAV